MEIVEKIKNRIKLNENSLKTIDFGIEATGAIEEENKFLNELLIICSSSLQLKEKETKNFVNFVNIECRKGKGDKYTFKGIHYTRDELRYHYKRLIKENK